MNCHVCGNEIEKGANTTRWDDQVVHVVCPGVDYQMPHVHPYHNMIFWGDVTPCSVWKKNPEISDEALVRDAMEHGFVVFFESTEDCPLNENEFSVDW